MAVEFDVLAFGEIVESLDDGQAVEELTGALRKLVARVRAVGKKGTLTLKLVVEPTKKRSGEMVHIVPDIDLKLPKFERGGELFFAGRNGDLARNPFHQRELPFDGPKAVEEAPPAQGETPEATTA